jgi:hypothetical protein
MALFIEIKAADGLVSRTRLEPGNNRFTVRVGDTYRIFDDQTGITPEDVAVKRVDNNLVVDGLDAGQAGATPTTVEFPEFYSICSAGSPCAITVDSGPQSAPVTVTPGTQPIGALSDGAFVLYDRDFAETAPAEPSLSDNTALRYGVYALGGLAVVGLAAGGGGGGGGGDGPTPDGALKLTSSTFVNSRTPLITGEAEPGARVTVRIDTDGDDIPNVTYATTAGPDFQWSVNLASAVPETGALPAGGLPDASNVSITATTDSGNVSLPVFVLAFDGVPPTPAILAVIASDNVVNAAEKTSGVAVAGEAEPGSTVTVTWGTQVRTAQADPAGKWQTPGFDSGSIPGDGPSTSTAVVQDLAGNNSAPTQATVTVNTAPARLDNLGGIGDINGSEAAAGITLTGRTDPNGTVSVNWNGAAKAPVTADGSGNWQVAIAPTEIPQVAEGSVPYQITATNVIGNTNAIGGQVAIDAVAPPAPIIATVAGDNVVNQAERGAGVAVSGTAERGADITVTWGSLTATGKADNGGNWTANFGAGSAPPDATYTITAVATDSADNQSGAGALAGVLVDTTPPAVSAATPDPIINIAEAAGGIQFSGTLEAGATATITWNGTTQPVVPSGTTWAANFAPPVTTPPLGDNYPATVTATDAHGNTATAGANVALDLVAPAAASGVTAANAGLVFTVSGGAEANSTVVVTVGAQQVAATFDSPTTWTTGPFFGVIGPGATASVTVTDFAGNPTTSTHPLQAEAAPPPAPPPVGLAELTVDAPVAIDSSPHGTPIDPAAASWSSAESASTLLPIPQPLEQPYA